MRTSASPFASPLRFLKTRHGVTADRSPPEICQDPLSFGAIIIIVFFSSYHPQPQSVFFVAASFRTCHRSFRKRERMLYKSHDANLLLSVLKNAEAIRICLLNASFCCIGLSTLFTPHIYLYISRIMARIHI